MENQQIQQLIEQGLEGVKAIVTGDGYHYEAVVIGACFEGKSMVQQQKMVYSILNEYITSGALHALTIKTYTPEQWEKAQK
jgi:acid stress-induced BolA-like protein IbaG/YrbA